MIESASCVTSAWSVTEHGVVLQQVRQGLRVGEVVDRHEFHVIAAQTGTDDIPADAAEAIDAYFDCHVFLLFWNEEFGLIQRISGYWDRGQVGKTGG